MDALKIAAASAEVAILASTAVIGWNLVGGSNNLLVVAPMIGAVLAVETLRLPLVMRIPKLGLASAAVAMTLAAGLSLLTGENPGPRI